MRATNRAARSETKVRIRGGRGLGDAIYLRPIAEHFVRSGAGATVLSDYPEVFAGSGAHVEPFDRNGGNIVAHYVSRKGNLDTTQWQDVCRSACVNVSLRFEWAVRNRALVDQLRAKAEGRPLILVHGGREPMARSDGFGLELVPQEGAFRTVLEALAPDHYLVQVGKAKQIYALPSHIDLNGTTSVSDVLDIASVCDGVVAQCSFAVPLAEALDKPLLAVWGARHACSSYEFIRQTTPRKVLSGPRDSFVFDNWPASQLREVAREFRYV